MIVGYREWLIQENRLSSLITSWALSGSAGKHFWLPGENCFTCYCDCREEIYHAQIQKDSSCGFHAYKKITDFPDVQRYGGHPVCSYIFQPYIVCGSVYLWGKVIEHKKGYRAEFAQIGALFWKNRRVIGYSENDLRRVANQYNVPVVRWKDVRVS